MSTHPRTLAALAAVAGLLMGMGAVWALRDTRTLGADPAGQTSADAPPPSGVPATLGSPVTRIATDRSAPDPLAIVAHAQTVVLTAPGRTRLQAAHLAHRLRAPLVVARDRSGGPTARPTGAVDAATATPAAGTNAVTAALRRLKVQRVVIVGDADLEQVARDGGAPEVVRLQPATRRHPSAAALLRWTSGGRAPGARTDPGFDEAAVKNLLDSRAAAPPRTVVAVLVRPRGATALRVALAARAVGHTPAATAATDVRADPKVVERLSTLPGDAPRVILGGRGMASVADEDILAQTAVAATGVQLPGGGQLVIDPQRPQARRYVGLYGVPHSALLGALGEQPVAASVVRTRGLVRAYQRAAGSDVDVMGCFEIIATVAARSAGRDRNFSRELPVAQLEPAVQAAERAGMYVLLDIQPGRSDFLTQAKRYRTLLRRPHVGLALDPEWRLRPRQKHLEQIGSVGVDEVNAVADWLAGLTRRNRLPQKMFLIHQFRLSMVRDRNRLDTSHDELAHVIQMDGQGPQGSKVGTWQTITAAPPDGVQFGWKNFYDEDTPVRTPEATMALTPAPVFVSYQ